MLRNLFLILLLTISFSAVVIGQRLPVPQERSERRVGFIFDDGRSYLGVQTQEISKENFAKFGLSEVRGVAVEGVMENSPAAKAGLEKGDVIVRFNGEEVSSVRKLSRLISEIAPDHQANLTIVRGGSEREISVILGKREVPKFDINNFPMENIPPFPSRQRGDAGGFVFRSGERRQIGIDVTPLTAQLGDYFGVASGKGLLIDNVRADSPAAKAGLKAGDVIIEADGKEVSGNLDLIRAINEKKEGSVTLTIVREKNRQTLTITPEKVKGTFAPDFEGFGNGELPGNFRIVTP